MNILGIDFEDWYHPELVQKHVKDLNHTQTMFKGLDKILNMLRKNETLLKMGMKLDFIQCIIQS